MVYLDFENLEGTLEPLRVYKTCVQVLAALQDERMADILQRGILLLHQQAYRLHDDALEAVFLKSTHAEQLVEMQNQLKDGTQ